eukprot:1655030-Prymnesium_polylepis.1
MLAVAEVANVDAEGTAVVVPATGAAPWAASNWAIAPTGSGGSSRSTLPTAEPTAASMDSRCM